MRASELLDPLTFGRLGKSVLAVWETNFVPDQRPDGTLRRLSVVLSGKETVIQQVDIVHRRHRNANTASSSSLSRLAWHSWPGRHYLGAVGGVAI